MSRLLKVFSFLLAACLALATAGPAFAATATPSTNADNLAKGWTHYEVLSVTETTAQVRFTNPRSFAGCFEVRTQGQGPSSATNPNPEILDGRWPGPPFTTSTPSGSPCLNANSEVVTLTGGNGYFEIRSVFGAEKDERFDWERIYLLTPSGDGSDPESSSSSPNVCNMALESAPEWIPYGDANVELHWPANGCDVHIRSLDGGPWIKLSFSSRTYTVAGGWVGVLAPLPFGVSPGWNVLTMGTNSFKVWVGHTPPPSN